MARSMDAERDQTRKPEGYWLPGQELYDKVESYLIELLMTQQPMNTSTRVCSWRHAWGLDNRIRKVVQNPYKIVGRYIEEGQIVLDLGCGPGVFSLAMAEMVGKTGKVISVKGRCFRC